MRAVAKGVRRTRSKFGARLEPMSHVDLQLHTGRSLDIVTQAEAVHPFAQYVGADYARYTAGTADPRDRACGCCPWSVSRRRRCTTCSSAASTR